MLQGLVPSNTQVLPLVDALDDQHTLKTSWLAKWDDFLKSLPQDADLEDTRPFKRPGQAGIFKSHRQSLKSWRCLYTRLRGIIYRPKRTTFKRRLRNWPKPPTFETQPPKKISGGWVSIPQVSYVFAIFFNSKEMADSLSQYFVNWFEIIFKKALKDPPIWEMFQYWLMTGLKNLKNPLHDRPSAKVCQVHQWHQILLGEFEKKNGEFTAGEWVLCGRSKLAFFFGGGTIVKLANFFPQRLQRNQYQGVPFDLKNGVQITKFMKLISLLN